MADTFAQLKSMLAFTSYVFASLWYVQLVNVYNSFAYPEMRQILSQQMDNIYFYE